jgi:uncharacterized protein YmfQ (DUF2313 family)
MNTELMEQILKSETAQRTIQYVSPIYGNSYIMLWIFEVIGEELDNMGERSSEVADQAFPQLATWGISYLEDQYGIIPPAGATLEDRRQAVLSFIHSRKPMNPAKMAAMVSAATGRTAKVIERTAKRTFDIEVDITDSETPFRLDVINMVDKVKPAHLLYRFIISTSENIYVNIQYRTAEFDYLLCGTFCTSDPDKYIGQLYKAVAGITIQQYCSDISYPLCGTFYAGGEAA